MVCPRSVLEKVPYQGSEEKKRKVLYRDLIKFLDNFLQSLHHPISKTKYQNSKGKISEFGCDNMSQVVTGTANGSKKVSCLPSDTISMYQKIRYIVDHPKDFYPCFDPKYKDLADDSQLSFFSGRTPSGLTDHWQVFFNKGSFTGLKKNTEISTRIWNVLAKFDHFFGKILEGTENDCKKHPRICKLEPTHSNGNRRIFANAGWIPMYARKKSRLDFPTMDDNFRGRYAYTELVGPTGMLRVNTVNEVDFNVMIGAAIQGDGTFYAPHKHLSPELYIPLRKSCHKLREVDRGALVQSMKFGFVTDHLAPLTIDDYPNIWWIGPSVHHFFKVGNCYGNKEQRGLVMIWARTDTSDLNQKTYISHRNLQDYTGRKPSLDRTLDQYSYSPSDFEFRLESSSFSTCLAPKTTTLVESKNCSNDEAFWHRVNEDIGERGKHWFNFKNSETLQCIVASGYNQVRLGECKPRQSSYWRYDDFGHIRSRIPFLCLAFSGKEGSRVSLEACNSNSPTQLVTPVDLRYHR